MNKPTKDLLQDALIEHLTPRIGERLNFAHIGLVPHIKTLINEMKRNDPNFKLKNALENLAGYEQIDMHTFKYVPSGSSVSNSAAASSVGYGGNSSAVAANSGFSYSAPSYAAILELREKKDKLKSLITDYLEVKPYGSEVSLLELYGNTEIKRILNEITRADGDFKQKAVRELISTIPSATFSPDLKSVIYNPPNALGIRSEVYGNNSSTSSGNNSSASSASSASSVSAFRSSLVFMKDDTCSLNVWRPVLLVMSNNLSVWADLCQQKHLRSVT
jgi:hypothetical protein